MSEKQLELDLQAKGLTAPEPPQYACHKQVDTYRVDIVERNTDDDGATP